MTLTAERIALRRGRGFSLDVPELEVRPGEVLGLLGSNGSGKTSLLHVLSGFLRPDTGVVRWEGRPLTDFSRAERAARVAIVPQESDVVPPLAVAEYVRLGRVPYRGLLQAFTDDDLAATREALDRCGLRELAREPLAELSGGQRQRARIARALAQGSQVLLLDEPTNHLDLAAIRDVALLVKELASTGTAFIASLHNIDVAGYVASRIAFMTAGRIAAAGPTREVLRPETVLRHLGVAVDAAPRGAAGMSFSLRFPEPAAARAGSFADAGVRP